MKEDGRLWLACCCARQPRSETSGPRGRLSFMKPPHPHSLRILGKTIISWKPQEAIRYWCRRIVNVGIYLFYVLPLSCRCQERPDAGCQQTTEPLLLSALCSGKIQYHLTSVRSPPGHYWSTPKVVILTKVFEKLRTTSYLIPASSLRTDFKQTH